jgi:hypothetical protein
VARAAAVPMRSGQTISLRRECATRPLSLLVVLDVAEGKHDSSLETSLDILCIKTSFINSF